ncbi:MFS transporter [Stenotrophomonas sp. 364]|uniref:MFS transporter n=1 Tax=Stenotrophomonas sp. 364 TaxID=2691571 RepID=UPI001318DEF3|nr:MFS transporter [Stenotrophomonas sp. 364]QHB71533.1 MFS transporter [Stenotrophomonas sp. 364]
MSTAVDAAASRTDAVLLLASAGCALTVLDTNVVGVVLPTIARDLSASFADIEWVVSAYVLCFASLLLPAGTLADRIGRRRLYLIGLVLFALASVACGLAAQAGALYLARAGQGAAAAFMLAPALSLIGHAHQDPARRARAWAIWGAIMGLTMVLAPLIGGAIATWLGWRWAFHINLPLCLLLAALSGCYVPESRDPVRRRIDVAGVVLFAGSMLSWTWALIRGPVEGWTSTAVLPWLASGVVLGAAFIGVERRRVQPMLDLRLFRIPALVGAVIAMFAYAAAVQVMASLLPLLLQNVRGDSVLQAGLHMLPFALAMLLLPFLGRRLGAHWHSGKILALGLGVAVLGNLGIALSLWQHSGPGLLLAMAVLGSGGGLLNGETQKAIMSVIPPDRAGMASGISTTARFSGILIGFATLGAVLSSHVRAAADAALTAAGSPVSPALLERVVVGELSTASDALGVLARAAYAQGAGYAFIAAALMALLAMLATAWLMRVPPR